MTSIVFEITPVPTTTTSASSCSWAAATGDGLRAVPVRPTAGAIALALRLLRPQRPALSLLSLLARRLERADLERDGSDLERAATGTRGCSNLAKRAAGDPERSRLASTAGALCPMALRSNALSCSLAASARSLGIGVLGTFVATAPLCDALGIMRAALVLACTLLEAPRRGVALRARSVMTTAAATGELLSDAAAVLRERELVLEIDLE